mmetsp:Transcript_6755/g.18356  ORF Transcript_6755/g.18356 Transcript_6755/m.18356 type:complete len:138 (+) Transcript_6755:807-1220(+)
MISQFTYNHNFRLRCYSIVFFHDDCLRCSGFRDFTRCNFGFTVGFYLCVAAAASLLAVASAARMLSGFLSFPLLCLYDRLDFASEPASLLLRSSSLAIIIFQRMENRIDDRAFPMSFVPNPRKMNIGPDSSSSIENA